MPPPPHPVRLVGGRVVTRQEVLDDVDVRIEGDRIVELVPRDEPTNRETVVAVDGAWLIPGLIDIHADYIERMVEPRPKALLDLRFALRQAERELVTHGITTMFHSLSLYGFDAFASSVVRQPDHTRALIELIHASHDAEHLIHHRCHARFEIDNVDRVEELAGYLQDGKVHLLSFMDHTPGQGQYRDLEVFRSTVKGYRGIDDAAVEKLVALSKRREKLDADAMRLLASLAARNGVAVASHDDDSCAKVDLARELGASISEFPITLEVARHARATGQHTVAGAPNVLLGGSHSGNLSATDAVLDGVVDVLCSDYYPAALLTSVFRLHRDHGLPLADAIALVTANPAEAVRMGDETGAIEAGKRADLLAVRALDDGTPVVERAFIAGVPVYAVEYRR